MAEMSERFEASKVPVALQEGGVQILRAVRTEVHERHQQRQIQEQLPVGKDRPAQLAPIGLARLFPDFGFLDAHADENGEQGGQAADERTSAASPSD